MSSNRKVLGMETSAAPQPAPAPVDAASIAQARRQVAAIKGFYIHLAVFVVVLAGLAGINAVSGGSWWVLWVLFGWGIGVAAHALAVFGRAPRAIGEWERKKLDQLLNER
jgi:fatty acid desaturase